MSITFVREVEHLDFVEAVEKTGRPGGDRTCDTTTRPVGATTREEPVSTRPSRRPSTGITSALMSSRDAAAARGYLRRERGYDSDVVRQYRLGWAPDGRDRLIRSRRPVRPPHLSMRGSPRWTGPAGTLISSGARLLFPIFEAGGQAGRRRRPAPAGRAWPEVQEHRRHGRLRQEPGPLRPQLGQEGGRRLGPRSSCARATPTSSACSGPASGRPWPPAVPPWPTGTSVLLTNFARRIVLAYDADAAGQAAAERYYEWEQPLRGRHPGRRPSQRRGSRRPGPAGSRGAGRGRSGRPGPSCRSASSGCSAGSDLAPPRGGCGPPPRPWASSEPHPNELVRDQYLMQVADRCRVDAGSAAIPAAPRGIAVRAGVAPRRASAAADPGAATARAPRRPDGPGPGRRSTGPGARGPPPGRAPPRGGGADGIERACSRHPVSRPAFDALAAQTTLHEAIERADPQTADLLQRLAVEESEADADDVMIRLVEQAGHRALSGLEAEMRQASPPNRPDYVPR